MMGDALGSRMKENYEHRALHGKTSGQMQEMLWSGHGVNWDSYDPRFKRGTLVWPEVVVAPVTFTDRRSCRVVTAPAVERRVWRVGAPEVFTGTSGFLKGLLGFRDRTEETI